MAGGSQREERLDTLLAKMASAGLEPEDYWWYLDLRRGTLKREKGRFGGGARLPPTQP